MEFNRKKPINMNINLIIITYFPAFYSSILSFNFLPMNKRRSKIYITSFVATIEIVFPDLPALAVLPDLWIKIFCLGGKSYWMT